MAEDNPKHNEDDSIALDSDPVGGDKSKPDPCQENLNGKEDTMKAKMHLDIEPPKENANKDEEKKSPKSSAGDKELTKRRPEDALNEIKTQDTHRLYCCVCKSNITKSAELFIKGEETDQYIPKPFVLWIPILIPSFLLPSFNRIDPPEPVGPSAEPLDPSTEPVDPSTEPVDPSTEPVDPSTEPADPSTDPVKGLWEKLMKVFLNWLLFLRLLSVVVLILISVIVLWLAKQHVEEDPLPPTPMYIKYLPVIASLFLVILAVPWRSIPVQFPDILHNYIVVPVQNLDIVKSIVYGGLIESITSLGVVSCAAGSGTSTLNVLALAIANLLTGLILIIHKLHGLITNQPRSHSANNDIVTDSQEEALYKEMLGNKDKRRLHCVVVVVSFLFFGLIPPLFYGLSFKRTNEGLYKVAIVLAASLSSVICLSFAKAYAFEIKKRWIVPVYTGMAVVASVLSFITSQLLSNMLEKYDFHELASDYSKR